MLRAVGTAALMVWHWTWADRSGAGPGAADAFLRFAAANGVVSLYWRQAGAA